MTTSKKPAQPKFEIDVNIDEFTVMDLEVIDKASRGEVTLSDEIAIFNKVINGGVRHLKASDIRKIRNAILEALVKDANDPN
jgi:hypothetical protein